MSKLIKLLNLTASDNDHEALLAMRMANRYVTETLKTTWEKIVSIDNRKDIYEEEEEEDDGEEIDYMLTFCSSRVKGPGANFILSLREQWARTGSLSQKQRAALKKFHDNAKRYQ